jgi:hypothetical protein
LLVYRMQRSALLAVGLAFAGACSLMAPTVRSLPTAADMAAAPSPIPSGPTGTSPPGAAPSPVQGPLDFTIELPGTWDAKGTQFLTILPGMERSSGPTVLPGTILTVAHLPLGAFNKVNETNQLLGYATIYDVTAADTNKFGGRTTDIATALKDAVAGSLTFQVPEVYKDAKGALWGFAVNQLGNATRKFVFLARSKGGRWQMLELGIIRQLTTDDMLAVAKSWIPQDLPQTPQPSPSASL